MDGEDLGAFTAVDDDAARVAAVKARGCSISDTITTLVSECHHCGAGAECFGQTGGPLVCKSCGAVDHEREIPSQPGERWALLRPGTGAAEVVAIFTGPRRWADCVTRGEQLVAPAPAGVDVGDLASLTDDGGFDGWY
jgi:hypothetical protein